MITSEKKLLCSHSSAFNRNSFKRHVQETGAEKNMSACQTLVRVLPFLFYTQISEVNSLGRSDYLYLWRWLLLFKWSHLCLQVLRKLLREGCWTWIGINPAKLLCVRFSNCAMPIFGFEIRILSRDSLDSISILYRPTFTFKVFLEMIAWIRSSILKKK